MKNFINWCKAVIASEDYVILDTETTDLYGEICDLAIIDTKGKELYNSLLKPTCEISADAMKLHHITNEMVASAPTIADEWSKICEIVGSRKVITYGAVFDSARLDQSLAAYNMPTCEWQFECAITRYADFWNAPSKGRYSNAPYQKLEIACYQQGIMLPPGLHRAMPDCKATLSLIRKVAATGLDSPTYKSSQKKMAVEKVATISGANYGLRDFPGGLEPQPGLWFGVHWDNGMGALMTFQGKEAQDFIIKNKVYAVTDLNGKECIILDSGVGAGKITFVRLVEDK